MWWILVVSIIVFPAASFMIGGSILTLAGILAAICFGAIGFYWMIYGIIGFFGMIKDIANLCKHKPENTNEK